MILSGSIKRTGERPFRNTSSYFCCVATFTVLTVTVGIEHIFLVSDSISRRFSKKVKVNILYKRKYFLKKRHGDRRVSLPLGR